ncbi:MAG: helix-turn-helix domain-containing protein [archaeon]
MNEQMEDTAWKIIKELRRERLSAAELSRNLKVSKSLINNCLNHLLEKGYIKKGKKSKSYCLAGDEFAYLFVISKGFTDKKIIQVDEQKRKLIKDIFNKKQKKQKKKGGGLL